MCTFIHELGMYMYVHLQVPVLNMSTVHENYMIDRGSTML